MIPAPSASFIRFATTIAIVVGLSLTAKAMAQNTPSANSAYGITDLGVLNVPGDTESSALAINASGSVVGNSISGVFPYQTHAYIWAPTSANATTGAMTDLGGLPGFICSGDRGSSRVNTHAVDINSSNQVAGDSWTSDGNCSDFGPTTGPRAALYSGGSVIAVIGIDLGQSYATGINDAGQIVGFIGPGNAGTTPWFFDTISHDLGTLPGFPFCLPTKINNNGQVIGHCQSPDLSSAQAFLHALTPRPGSNPPYAVGSLTEQDVFVGGSRASPRRSTRHPAKRRNQP